MVKNKNYNVNPESLEHSKTIKEIKQEIRIKKKQLKLLPIGSLFSMDKMCEERKKLLRVLKSYKEMLVGEREANRASICRANDGHYPSFYRKQKPKVEQTEMPNPRTNNDTIDFILDRQDVIRMIDSLSLWLEKTRGTRFAQHAQLSIVSSKLKK